MAVLLAVIGSGAYVSRRHRAIVKTALSMSRRLKQRQPLGTQVAPSTASGPRAPRADLFASVENELTGPGAEDAIRCFVVDTLIGRQSDAVELVLTRTDAWRLFGIEHGMLRGEQIPGLTLTDDAQQTCGYLARRGLVRRILITCDGEMEDVRESRANERELTVISLSERAEGATRIAADGRVTPRAAAPLMPSCLPLLSKSGAFGQLTSMPTLATSLAD
ncbi:hypothetical protein LUW74_32810 [Actinomadura madurae]|uniref:hypothetical protein n=1 Tax=Actinomadura madurae TaxID=1993 RepID=UPI0020266A36|nr:hypothetical protein [Actinomadura madurae]URN07668.1 hypothetical protein LUW74_32810 [Actinomadura madurae]